MTSRKSSAQGVVTRISHGTTVVNIHWQHVSTRICHLFSKCREPHFFIYNRSIREVVPEILALFYLLSPPCQTCHFCVCKQFPDERGTSMGCWRTFLMGLKLSFATDYSSSRMMVLIRKAQSSVSPSFSRGSSGRMSLFKKLDGYTLGMPRK